ncbi:MAG TPA: MBL fold metallo-hydrolase [Clostridiaceae bacterium]|nr:MBL fold metallo-hydrolase [Clostridiaceae bacterium]
MKLTYMLHSGFAVELAESILVFDCYSDPARILRDISQTTKPVIFFVTHEHGDHFSAMILQCANRSDRPVTYIVDRETVAHFHLHEHEGLKSAHLIVTEEGMIIDAKKLAVPGLNKLFVYASNDAGVAYIVFTSEGVIYHAGDLNFWDWLDEEAEWMERFYRMQLKKMAIDLERNHCDVIDVAMIPVDKRLQNRAFLGADVFCRYLQSTLIVPMHLNGGTNLPSRLAERYAVPCYRNPDELEIQKNNEVIVKEPSHELTRKPRHIPTAIVEMIRPGQWLEWY